MPTRKDKYTGKRLVPIQVWVDVKTRAKFTQTAKKHCCTVQDMLRKYIENMNDSEIITK